MLCCTGMNTGHLHTDRPALPADKPRLAVRLKEMDFLLIVLLFAVVNRGLLLLYYSRSYLAPCLGLDPEYYFSSAVEIAKGYLLGDYGLYAGGPFYPYFLGAAVSLFGKKLLFLRIVQATVGVATNLMVARLGYKLFDKRTGLVAGIAYAFCGPLLFNELGFENEFLISFFMSAALLIVVSRRAHTPLLFLSGVLLGLASITRPNQLLACILFLLGLYLLEKDFKAFIRKAAVMAFGIVLMIAPITIRNYFLFHEIIPVSISGGYVFYIGNNPSSAYAYKSPDFGDSSFEGEFQSAWSEANRRTGKILSPGQASSYWLRQGLHYVVSEPGKVLGHYRDRIRAFVNDYELPDNYNYYFYRKNIPMLQFLFISFGLLLPASVIGLFLLNRREHILLLIQPATSFITVLILSYNARYRVTAYQSFIILGAAGVVYLFDLVRRKKAKKALLYAVCMSLAAVISFQRSPHVYDDYHSLLMAGKCLRDENPSLSMQRYGEAISLRPADTPAYYDLAEFLVKRGELSSARAILKAMDDQPNALLKLAELEHAAGNDVSAVDYLKKALAIRPNYFPAYAALGGIYKDRHRLDEAIENYRTAVALNPISVEARLNLSALYREAGLREEAKRELLEILRIQPSHPEAARLMNSL